MLEINTFDAHNSVLVPFFTNYPLKTSKFINCMDFINVLNMINNKVHLTLDGLLAQPSPDNKI